MKILYLPVKAQWYDMIECEEKPEEYREHTPYWVARLMQCDSVVCSEDKCEDCIFRKFKHYDAVCFSYGYTKRRMLFECKEIIFGQGRPEWGSTKPQNFYYQTWKTTKLMVTKRKTKIKVPVIDIFCQVAKQSLGVEFVKEFQFHKVRKWRFDYALPSHKIALEVEGGAFSYGRHTRASGFIADMEKYNTATCMGWRIVRCTPRQLLTNDTIQMISQLMKISPEAVPQVDNSEIQ